MTDDRTATWQSILTPFLAPALVAAPFAVTSAEPVILIGLGVGAALTVGLFLWTGFLWFAVRKRNSVTYVHLLRGLGFSLLGLVIPLLVLGLAMQLSRQFEAVMAPTFLIGGIWTFAMQGQALRELAGLSFLRVLVTVLAGLFGVAVVAVATFYLIFALTFGDPCGTTGPCRVYSDSFSGVTTVGPGEPVARIPFEASFSEVALTEGEVGVKVDYYYSWAGVDPPAETVIAFETSLGSFQATAPGDICFEVCQGPGEMVIRWPEAHEEGSLRVRWILQSVAGFGGGPPRGAEALLTVEEPPTSSPDRLSSAGAQDPVEPQYAMSAGHMNFDDLGMTSGRLRFGWPSHGEVQTQEQVVRWASGEATLRSGMAVEVPVEELCAPGCDVDLIARWLSQPVGLLRPIVAWVEVVPDEPVEHSGYDFEFVPVPSLRSEAVSQSVELSAEGARTLILTVTSPLSREAPQPVGLVAVDAGATGFTGESYLEVLEIGVGDKEFWLDADRDHTETPFETPVPLTCTVDACTVEVPIRLLSTSKQPVSVELAVQVDVFHPEFDVGTVQIRFSE